MSESALDSAAPFPGPVDRIRGVAVPDTRLHPIYLVIETARTLRSAIPFLVVTFLGGAPWWVNVTLFVLIMIVAIAQWYVRKYSVISGVLRLRSGLFNRTVRVVPITRITALDAYRSLSQRIVGVWGLRVQSPGDRGGAAVSLGSLSTSRLTELQIALETVRPLPDTAPYSAGSAEATEAEGTSRTADEPRATGERAASGNSGATDGPPSSAEPQAATKPAMASILHRFSRRRRDPKRPDGYETIAVLTTQEMLIAAVTNNSIPLIFAIALVVWYRFSEYVPSRAQDFMTETVEPRGVLAVVTALVVTAVVAGVVLSALRLNRFTLIRDGDVLRNHRGLLGKQTATIPVARVQAVRVVEGVWRTMLGYAHLQVEVAGIGRANTNQRMLFPLVRTARAAHLVRRVLPELHWPEDPLHPIPERIHRRYLTLPLEYGMGFTLLLLFLPEWWRLLALLPLPLGYWLGVARAREARWWVGERSVLLRWRRLLARNTVVAHRDGVQEVEWSSSPWKARARVAGFKMRFSSGRSARIRYMADDDALMLTHVVGRDRTRVPGVPD
ncbi:MAG TPA: PH domain-containing protein, partial [Mycobacterium sp.]